MKKILVVGQGIAGTALATELLRRGAWVEIADLPADLPAEVSTKAGASSFVETSAGKASASSVAAGIINPVTGKRFAQSWRVDEFLPAARNFYQKLELEIGQTIWHELPILKLLATIKEENDWSSRCALPELEKYIAPRRDAGDWSRLVREGFFFGEIRQSARVNFQVLTKTMRQRWQQQGIFSNEKIDAAAAERLLPEFDHLIFCEGWRAAENPFFKNLDWQLAKGEALILKIEDPRAAAVSQILKKKIMLVPLGEGRFWAGANYEWNFSDSEPTAAGKDFLLDELSQTLAVPFRIEQHLAGIRPTMQSRRPVARLLADFPKIGIFNGLGTKGALLAPFFARQFADEVVI